jgi:phospholipase/carboxylesterase
MTLHPPPLLRGAALQNASVVCVLTHGRGQSPELMEQHIVTRLKAEGVSFILPRAATGSWYEARAIDPLTPTTQTQLEAALAQLKQAAENAPAHVPVVMAGFSQGACLTLEYAMRFGGWNGAMVSLTGCRVGVPSDQRPQSDLKGLPVYLTGADKDPWIPLSAFAAATLALGSARARLRTDVFPGRAHEVSDAEIVAFDKMLLQLVSTQKVQW